jgi:lambda family phage portal protein
MAKPGLISRTLVKVARSIGGARVAGWTQSILGGGKAGYDANNTARRILNNRPGDRTAMDLSLSELPALRSHARQLERNNPTARAACDATCALVVGSGIALEPDQSEWSEAQTEKVRKEWLSYCDDASVDGRSIYELQTQGWREIFVPGELLWRFVIDPARKKRDQLPLCLLPLESEWLDGTSGAMMQVFPDKSCKVGPITVDVFGRPISYDLRNPENIGSFPSETVAASSVIHLFEKRRSMQTRGESWLAPVIETLNQERDLVATELQAAKTGASIGLAITSDYHESLDTTEDGDSDDPAQSLRIGGVARMYPGEKVEPFMTTRPSQQIMPFRAGLRGDTAAALRTPQRFLDRDISRVGSYSAMRGDNQDEERLMGPVREWYGHGTIGRVYKEVLPYICAKVGVPLPRAIKYKLLPDGQPYVDPEKDIAASQSAINAGLSTKEIEVGKRGGDWRAIAKQKQSEDLRESMAAIENIKAIQKECDASGVPGLTWSHILTLSGAGSAPGAYLAASVSAPAAEVVTGNQPAGQSTKPPDQEDQTDDEDDGMRSADRLRLARIEGAVMSGQRAPSTVVEQRISMDAATAAVMGDAIGKAIPAQAAPVVNVEAAQITVQPAPVSVQAAIVNVPEQPAPVVHVAAPVVNVSAPSVTVENEVIVPSRTVKATPQRDGSVLMVPQE